MPVTSQSDLVVAAVAGAQAFADIQASAAKPSYVRTAPFAGSISKARKEKDVVALADFSKTYDHEHRIKKHLEIVREALEKRRGEPLDDYDARLLHGYFIQAQSPLEVASIPIKVDRSFVGKYSPEGTGDTKDEEVKFVCLSRDSWDWDKSKTQEDGKPIKDRRDRAREAIVQHLDSLPADQRPRHWTVSYHTVSGSAISGLNEKGDHSIWEHAIPELRVAHTIFIFGEDGCACDKVSIAHVLLQGRATIVFIFDDEQSVTRCEVLSHVSLLAQLEGTEKKGAFLKSVERGEARRRLMAVQLALATHPVAHRQGFFKRDGPLTLYRVDEDEEVGGSHEGEVELAVEDLGVSKNTGKRFAASDRVTYDANTSNSSSSKRPLERVAAVSNKRVADEEDAVEGGSSSKKVAKSAA